VRFLFVTTIAILISVGAARADDAADLKDTWKPTEGKHAGEPLSKDLIDSITLTLTDGMYQVKVAGLDESGTVKIDATKTPKTMDIVATEGKNKGRKVLAIYDLTGDTLKVCYDVQGGPRPVGFESTAENKMLLVIYKRKK
jgi:uncharacterized protein (TIGR03067 family)